MAPKKAPEVIPEEGDKVGYVAHNMYTWPCTANAKLMSVLEMRLMLDTDPLSAAPADGTG